MPLKNDCCRNTHYGNCMEPHKMREWGPKMAANIEAVIAEGKYPILIYRGMSGIAAATTIANFMSSNHGDDYAMMYVRKKNEKSHGRIIEYTKYNIAGREIVWIFCDDFISSGKTVLEVVRAICHHFDIEIAFDTIYYALALEPSNWVESFSLNDIHGALVNQYYSRNEVIKTMRRRHRDMLRTLRKGKEESKNRHNQLLKSRGWGNDA